MGRGDVGWIKIYQMADFCELGNEISGSIEGRGFLYQLNYCELLNKALYPRSYTHMQNEISRKNIINDNYYILKCDEVERTFLQHNVRYKIKVLFEHVNYGPTETVTKCKVQLTLC
jgi:hypothetical protein